MNTHTGHRLFSIRTIAIAITIAVFGAMLPQTAGAQRASLGGIDAKLDELLDLLRNGPPPPTARIIFQTSTRHNGNLGGLTGADDICNLRATEANLPGAGTYRAWLSDSTKAARDRLVRSPVTYVLPDGDNTDLSDNPVVATDFADLTDGAISIPIGVAEDGAPGPLFFTWTGTLQDGNLTGSDCQGWTATIGEAAGTAGNPTRTDSRWTDELTRNCTFESPLYCVQN